MTLQTGTIDTRDPCLYEQAYAPSELMTSQLSQGAFGHTATYLVTPRVTLFYERFRCRIRDKGLSPPNNLIIAVPDRVGSNSSWWGAPLHEKGMPIMLPGGVDVEYSVGQSQFIVEVDLGFVREYLSGESVSCFEAAARQHVLPAAKETIERLGWKLGVMLHEAQVQPEMRDHPAAINSLEQEILHALAQCDPGSMPRHRGRGQTARRIAIARVNEYIRSINPKMTTVADLCTAARVSQRTLEYVFRDSFGLSPLGFLHLHRFHATRRALLAADHESVLVQEVARDNGIYHMGRFAVRYKEFFGESPSQTLRRPPEKGESPLIIGTSRA